MEYKVHPSSGLQGRIEAPPDKSIAHRAAMFSALANGESVIQNYSLAADPQSTVSCLRQLGVSIQQDEKTLTVTGVGRYGLKIPSETLDCGNSGTTLRLLSGILSGAGIECELSGDASLNKRTMKRIIDPLRKFGANISGRDDDYAPIRIGAHAKLTPFRYELPVASAQLKSCMLLAGLYGDEPMQVVETIPSRNHTELLLELPVDKEKGGKVVISSQRSNPIPEQNYRIPGDFSSAFFWLVAGIIVPGSRIEISRTGLNPTRTGALRILKKMGANITVDPSSSTGNEPSGNLVVTHGNLKACDVNGREIPLSIDELPALAIAMAFSDGISTIREAGELRHKECDRLEALAALFKTAGVRYEEYPDGLKIYGNPGLRPRPGSYSSFHDHRIAMSAAVLALRSSHTCRIMNAECAGISYPGFWNDLTNLSV